MRKSAAPEQRRRRGGSTRAAGRKADIGATLAGIEEIEATTPQAAKVLASTVSWPRLPGSPSQVFVPADS